MVNTMPLKNTCWELRTLQEGCTSQPIISGTRIIVMFDVDRVNGSSGCNLYRGQYLFDSTGSFNVSGLSNTLRLCPTPVGIMEQEARYMDFFSSSSSFSRSGSSLKLSSGAGASEKVLLYDEIAISPYKSKSTAESSSPLSCKGAKTKDWYAWNNKMPPKPDDFHIVGEVEVPNPGVIVSLVPRVPQGINPKILLMDLHLRQLPGVWPQVTTWKQVRYDKILVNSEYESVTIFCGADVVANIPVDTIH